MTFSGPGKTKVKKTTTVYLMCDILVPMEFLSGPVSQELPICLIWDPSYGPQHVSVDPQHILPV